MPDPFLFTELSASFHSLFGKEQDFAVTAITLSPNAFHLYLIVLFQRLNHIIQRILHIYPFLEQQKVPDKTQPPWLLSSDVRIVIIMISGQYPAACGGELTLSYNLNTLKDEVNPTSMQTTIPSA